MLVPIGCGMLNVAAWMVPKGEATTCWRQRMATAGWRASNAPKSWNPICVGGAARTTAPNPIRTSLRARPFCDTALTTLNATRNAVATCLSAAWRQCDRCSYCPVNLAAVQIAAVPWRRR